MPYLVRKIQKSKWPSIDVATQNKVEEIRADAVTSCLRTSKDTLSLWRINTIDDLDDAVLALASSFERLDTIDLALIDLEDIQEAGFIIKETPGLTPVEDLVDWHVDVAELDYSSIGKFSELILKAIRENLVYRYRNGKVKQILRDALEEGRIKQDTLKESLYLKVTA